MWNNEFLDYVEIRRRIERLLPGMQAVFVHLVLFLAAVVVFLAVEFPRLHYYSYTQYFMEPGMGFFMTVWSVLLVLHGLWLYRRSGSAAAVREQAVEREIQARLEQGDTALLEDQRRVFRIRGLLDEDIRQRAGLNVALLTFLAVNVGTWLVWASHGAVDSYTWQMTIPTALAFLIPAFVLNLWRRRRRDTRLRSLMSERTVAAGKAKRKLSFDDIAERAVHLSDDGELVNLDNFDDDLREADHAKQV
jgi:hypothetical protein